MRTISIATEDTLSQAVAERLLANYRKLHIVHKFGCRGNGYLISNLKKFFEFTKTQGAFLLITDLDRKVCAPSLIANWQDSVNIPLPNNFLFRVAVQEIESWLLADREAFSKFIGVSKIPINPDVIDNPKEKLLEIAKNSSKKDIRDDLVKKEGAIASQGIGYNNRLIDFVKKSWCPKRASENSESLRRTCTRLEEINKHG